MTDEQITVWLDTLTLKPGKKVTWEFIRHVCAYAPDILSVISDIFNVELGNVKRAADDGIMVFDVLKIEQFKERVTASIKYT